MQEKSTLLNILLDEEKTTLYQLYILTRDVIEDEVYRNYPF